MRNGERDTTLIEPIYILIKVPGGIVAVTRVLPSLKAGTRPTFSLDAVSIHKQHVCRGRWQQIPAYPAPRGVHVHTHGVLILYHVRIYGAIYRRCCY